MFPRFVISLFSLSFGTGVGTTVRAVAPALFGLFLSTALLASPPRLASFTLENDFFAGFDRHYTNGIQFAFLVDVADLPEGLRSRPPFSWSADPQAVVAVGQRIYTPADTVAEDPNPRDRPYAGWLYFMTDVLTRAGSTIDHVMATVGVVGPASLAQRSQNAFHRLTGSLPARGWRDQIGNEVTVMLGYERARPGVWRYAGSDRQSDLSLRAGAAMGNVLTYASAGAVLRFGTNLPPDLPATHVSLGPPRDGFRGAAGGFRWYVWAGLDARVIAHNIFIDGNTFRHSHSVQREPFGYDLQFGIASVWPATRVGFTIVERSREFVGQDRPDRFGQLAVSFAF